MSLERSQNKFTWNMIRTTNTAITFLTDWGLGSDHYWSCDYTEPHGCSSKAERQRLTCSVCGGNGHRRNLQNTPGEVYHKQWFYPAEQRPFSQTGQTWSHHPCGVKQEPGVTVRRRAESVEEQMLGDQMGSLNDSHVSHISKMLLDLSKPRPSPRAPCSSTSCFHT